jgi:hypothetical protein
MIDAQIMFIKFFMLNIIYGPIRIITIKGLRWLIVCGNKIRWVWNVQQKFFTCKI